MPDLDPSLPLIYYLQVQLRQHVPTFSVKSPQALITCWCGETFDGDTRDVAAGRWADHVALEIEKELSMMESPTESPRV